MAYAIKLKPGKPVDLTKIDPDDAGGLAREQAEAKYEALAAELGELQELMYAAQTKALLVVLQGLDTSGKDGAIRGVFKDVNPQGCRVTAFKVPTAVEAAHDFLWRVHRHTPERGLIAVFNRSHYEEVLVVRVHELAPEAVWRKHYDHINAFERLIADSETIIAKFYLHIGKDEQEQRLVARERDVEKAWKLSAADWVERRSWENYRTAYEDALANCTTAYAPWYVVPANHKWFRNLAISETLVNLLRPFKKEWLDALAAKGEAELKAIREARAQRRSATR
jgi:PPK2 family polyphosphate:nucleotide phosphotransferase